ncbi:MAG: hypothetical protein KGL43_04590 [Burkholderiales bacterium]|nr:hypothetical protein [Burkholderiales bacterium]MDE2452850.1 hypothetical protein [Burkholderiales bacterium]
MEHNMVMLLLEPAFPARLSLAALLMGALGVLVAPMATAAAYRWSGNVRVSATWTATTP